MPKISREAQLTTRTASNQAARLAWQDLRAEHSNAGENVRGNGSRRHAVVASTQSQPMETQQVLADSQQP